MSLFYSFLNSPPEGISFSGPMRNSQFEFIHDVSYQQDGEMIYERQIFSKIKSMIAEASGIYCY